jgi:FkbM family methyltransferase
MEALIAPGSVVYDVGAHVGFYTLLFSELVGPAGRVVAFEPNPRNVAYLKRHLKINDTTNAHVVEAAASDSTGIATFADDGVSFTGRLSSQGSLNVPTVTLDEFVQRENAPQPDYIKIDVEGAEYRVLHGADKLLGSAHPTIFLATHGQEVHAKCCAHLEGLGYHLQPLMPNASITHTDEIIASHS